MKPPSVIGALSLFYFFLRMVEAILQTLLILYGNQLVLKQSLNEQRPGRQAITFLLLVNLTLWLVNTFETQRITSNSTMLDFYGADTWTLIVNGTVPLIIFFRFHSSVCLAEIWKHAYKQHPINGSQYSLSVAPPSTVASMVTLRL